MRAEGRARTAAAGRTLQPALQPQPTSLLRDAAPLLHLLPRPASPPPARIPTHQPTHITPPTHTNTHTHTYTTTTATTLAAAAGRRLPGLPPRDSH